MSSETPGLLHPSSRRCAGRRSATGSRPSRSYMPNGTASTRLGRAAPFPPRRGRTAFAPAVPGLCRGAHQHASGSAPASSPCRWRTRSASAEDTAVLDLLSGGRLELGARHRRDARDLPRLRARQGTAPAIFARQARHACAKPGAARRSAMTATGSTPRPAAGRPGLAGDLFGRGRASASAQAGDGLMLSRTQPRSAGRPAGDAAGNPAPDRRRLSRNLPTRRRAAHPGLALALRRRQPAGGAAACRDRPQPRARRFIASGHQIADRSLPGLIKAFDAHVGTPDDVVASLAADTALARVTDIVFQVHSVDPPHPLILRSIELTAQEVAPALGWRGQARSAPTARTAAAQPAGRDTPPRHEEPAMSNRADNRRPRPPRRHRRRLAARCAATRAPADPWQRAGEL